MSDLTILGGGFAGVWAAMSAAAERKALGEENITISLVTKDPCLTIRPRLYEGAKEEMRVPLAPLMTTIGANLITATASGIDPGSRSIDLADGGTLAYRRLVLATGSRLKRIPVRGADEYCHCVDTYEEAASFDEKLVSLRDTATAIVIGASFTGLELATELRTRMGAKARIVLIDSAERAGIELGNNPRAAIEEALNDCRIETRFGRTAERISAGEITLDDGERIETDVTVLATGMEASPLTKSIPGEKDRHGRLMVGPDLKVFGASDIFAAGDTANVLADDTHEVFMSCQHAMPLGQFAGHNALRDLLGLPTRAFRKEFYATCLDLGPWGALFTTGWNREIQKAREEGKEMKRQINTQWIYPPSPDLGADAIFEAVALPVATDPEPREVRSA
ncbi:NAD(P)/FAD-dependent oxidoreductase [Stappia sp. GBMRC 2046]|uniref:NAD(P)/FAD-dependent oxidoreductase n=1 Tax=Stappia sediminis TaxID=2692190 RepID=A0A7X3LX33_9HYPH|nr:FAD-dependent oxidoreductase [Stappia sediminis]MXN66655.1 NAD(P)/FAD-dependent oxidoreductase [Stappia sediminis]